MKVVSPGSEGLVRNAGWCEVSAVVLLWAMAGCGSLGTSSKERAPESGDEADFPALDDRISAARNAGRLLGWEGHPDYGPLAELLAEYQGDLDATTYICGHFDPFFCWKEASIINPDLRDEICTSLAEDISAQYGDRLPADRLERMLNGAKEDCQLGRPQLQY